MPDASRRLSHCAPIPTLPQAKVHSSTPNTAGPKGAEPRSAVGAGARWAQGVVVSAAEVVFRPPCAGRANGSGGGGGGGTATAGDRSSSHASSRAGVAGSERGPGAWSTALAFAGQNHRWGPFRVALRPQSLAPRVGATVVFSMPDYEVGDFLWKFLLRMLH